MKMMHQADKKNILAQEQYGNRKKKKIIERALSKRFTFDILRHTKLPAGI